LVQDTVPDNFENEVFSDLTGERGVLMGALAGSWMHSTRFFGRTGIVHLKLLTKQLRINAEFNPPG